MDWMDCDLELEEIQVSTLRAFLTFIARDLGIDDLYGERSPVTVTREIRQKIAELRGAIKDVKEVA